jgi:hypothetical protein
LRSRSSPAASIGHRLSAGEIAPTHHRTRPKLHLVHVHDIGSRTMVTRWVFEFHNKLNQYACVIWIFEFSCCGHLFVYVNYVLKPLAAFLLSLSVSQAI